MDWDEFIVKLKKKHGNRILITVAPPRSCSTVFCSMIARFDGFSWLSNEPFERSFYLDEPVREQVQNALMNRSVFTGAAAANAASNGAEVDESPFGSGLVVKAISYAVQKADGLDPLLRMTDLPLVFLIRDPRRCALSRINGYTRKQEPVVPESLNFSGFQQLNDLVGQCRARGHPFVIVNTSDLRNSPGPMLELLFQRLGLKTNVLLRWEPGTISSEAIDNMKNENDMSAWYERALNSSQLEPEDAGPPPDVSTFPENVRPVVQKGLEIFNSLSILPQTLCLKK